MDKSTQYKQKTVLFIDLDGTLIDGPFNSVVFPRIFKEFAQKSGRDEGEIRQLIFQENFSRQKNPHVPAILAMDWDDIVACVAHRLGISVRCDVLKMVQSYAKPPFSTLLDDAIPVLHSLLQPHRALVLATKGLYKYQSPILEGLGLLPFFDDILTPDRYNSLKNKKKFYGHWPQSIPLQISIGDHYIDDVVMPNSFGFQTVWKTKSQTEIVSMSPLYRPEKFTYSKDQDIPPRAIIFTLQELPALIEEIEEESLRRYKQHHNFGNNGKHPGDKGAVLIN